MSTPVSYPRHFSRFYDIIYEQYKNYLDHRFFLDQIKKTGGKTLEAGVGTGRFYMDALEQTPRNSWQLAQNEVVFVGGQKSVRFRRPLGYPIPDTPRVD